MRKYECLYKGGKLFKDNIKQFLPRERIDNDYIYRERCNIASYRSYVGPIVDYYAAQLFNAPYHIRPVDAKGEPKATPDEFYAIFREDCDAQGTDLSTFMRQRFVEVLVKGKSYLLVEMPDVGDVPPENLLDYKARGLDRAKLVCLPAESVLDWEIDEATGDYAWVITHHVEHKRPGLAIDPITIHTWRYYTPDEVKVYQETYNPGREPQDEDDVIEIESYPHGCSRVPIIPICATRRLCLLKRFADAQIEHFRLSAALGWSLRRSAYAMMAFMISDKENPPKTGAGLGILLGKEESVESLEPNGSSFKILQDEIAFQKDEIHRVSAQMAMAVDNNAAGLGRSGLSKMADTAATEICLRGYAVMVKDAIEKLYELISDARGDTETKFSIEGLNQFTLIDATTLIANATTARGLAIQSETFQKELDKRVAEALLPSDTAQTIKDKIRDEIDSAKKPDPMMPGMVPGMGADEEPNPRPFPDGTSPFVKKKPSNGQDERT